MNCSLCRDFGKVHPHRPDGKVDYSSLIYCACQGDKAGKIASAPPPEEEPRDHYVEMPFSERFDYPMSWDFWRAACKEFGHPDPGPCEPPKERDTDIELRVSNLESTQYEPGSIPRRYHHRTQQLEGRVLHAEAKLQEHITASKKKAQPKGPRWGLKEIET